MSKKRTIALTISAIAVALGIGAQFYTNHKIDQVLKNFPYSLDNQATLNVTQTAKNFFIRELIFSVKNSEAKNTNVISTKLTALPFFITAESQLSDQLVRQLNKTLNITIDKNTINSKFSPVGDYLQSDILTEFRDFANKSQNLSIGLNFLKNKEVELKTTLSGFNYDKDTKLEQIEGEAHLVPVGANQYDLSSIELTAKNAELALLNGENTHIYLKNATYHFDVKPGEADKRDLSTKFSSDILRVANKSRMTEESQATAGGLNLLVKQNGVPSSINFHHEFKKLSDGSLSIKDGVNLLTKIFTQNDRFDGSLSVLSVNVPKNNQPYFNLQNAGLELKLANTDLTKANVDFKLNVESVKQTPADEDRKWEAKGGKVNIQLDDYNVANELAFVPFLLDTIAEKEAPSKDNKDFLNAKDKWVKEFRGKTNIEAALKSFNMADLVLDNVSASDKTETLDNDQYNEHITLSANKIGYPSAGLQFEKVAGDVPFKINHSKAHLSARFCSVPFYGALCSTHLTSATFDKYIKNSWKELDLIVDNATLNFNLNTYPETTAYPVKLEVSGIVPQVPEDDSSDMIPDNIEGTFNLTLSKMLFDDQNEKALAIKENSYFWQYLSSFVKHDGKLHREFVEEGDNYVSRVEKTENGYLINGRTIEDLSQESMMETDEGEEGKPVTTD